MSEKARRFGKSSEKEEEQISSGIEEYNAQKQEVAETIEYFEEIGIDFERIHEEALAFSKK